MLPPGATALSKGDAPLASGKEAARNAAVGADEREPCAGGWVG